MIDSLADRLKQTKPLLLDGAIGTELNRRGVETSLPLWSTNALWDAPDVLRDIHRDYLEAGAEIITANTFRTQGRTLAHAGMEGRACELTKLAVEIARDAANERAWIAGSMAPLEDCYSPQLVPSEDELKQEHSAIAAHLAESGVDLVLVETQNTIREAVVATHAATQTGLPVFVSFTCGLDGRLLSGESVTAAAKEVLLDSPMAILLNCLPADAALKPLEELRCVASAVPIGVYANVGRSDANQGWINTDAVAPERYSAYAQEWLDGGASMIGGCCGTTPEHIRELRRLLI